MSSRVAEAIAIRGTDIVDAEGFIGSLEVGKRADLIVLDQNPFDSTAQEIPDINVLATSRKSSNSASNSESDPTSGCSFTPLLQYPRRTYLSSEL